MLERAEYQTDFQLAIFLIDNYLSMGDVESVIFPLSAMKPLQSIALIDLLKTLQDIPEITDAEVALICASHNGETLLTDAVQGLLGFQPRS